MTQDRTAYVGHSSDFKHDVNGEGKLHQAERDLGIRSMLAHMADAGWDSYQWRNSVDGKTSFLELSGTTYSDFKRANSTTGVKAAVEQVLNRVQAISKCEQTTGHDFTGRDGYNNGVLACKHCGFGGYASNFRRQQSELEQWKHRAEDAVEKLGIVGMRLGVHFNIAGDILLAKKNIAGEGETEGYSSVSDTDEVSFIIKREGGSK